MSDDNNGPAPGILGSEENDSKPTSSADMIFDNKEFIGDVKTEPKQQKEFKVPPIFTKWYLWAGVCIVVILASVTTTIVTIASRNAEALAKYDEVIAKINSNKSQFNDGFDKYVRQFFDISEDSNIDQQLFPDEEEREAGAESCLGRFGASKEDLKTVKRYQRGEELAKDGVDIKQATERATRVLDAYNNAPSAMSTCYDDLLGLLSNYFDVEIGEFYTEESTNGLMLNFHQPISIKYKGKRDIRFMRFDYQIYDKNGVKTAITLPELFKSSLKAGEIFETDIYANGLFHYALYKDKYKNQKYIPKLIKVHADYASSASNNNT
jgi:hypothetical protein